MAIERLVGHFGAVVDPRCRGKVEHRLTDILVIAVCAVIACAESWNDIALYGRSKLAWLRTFLALPNGIPSHDTFRPARLQNVYANKSLTAAGFVPRVGVRGWRSWQSRCAQQRGRARGHRRC
jgi:hypothetical protein